MLILTDERLSTLTGRCAVQEPDIQPRSTRGVRLLNHIVHAQEQRLRTVRPSASVVFKLTTR
jgi:hypothetical protein